MPFAEGVAMLFLIYARFSGVFGEIYKESIVLRFKKARSVEICGVCRRVAGV